MDDSAYILDSVFIKIMDANEKVLWSSRTGKRSEISFPEELMGKIGDTILIEGTSYVVNNMGIYPNQQGWNIEIIVI